MTGTERRKTILERVEQCVCHDRQNNYGPPEDCFADIATIWNVILRRKLGAEITAADVGVCLNGVKTARYAANPDHLDNAVDGAGYWVCVGGIQLRRSDKDNG